jgi:hypothetical protein
MSATWSIYSLTTGELMPARYVGDQPYAEANAGEGCGVIEGRYDHLSQRVDLESLSVVDWQPDAPADDAMRTWAWDAETRRWIGEPTLAALRAARQKQVEAAMFAIDSTRIRPNSEIALAVAAGLPAPGPALARLEETEAKLVVLRAVRDTMQAAADQAELDAIAWP